jgi:hypothetical protein
MCLNVRHSAILAAERQPCEMPQARTASMRPSARARAYLVTAIPQRRYCLLDVFDADFIDAEGKGG